MNYKAIITMVSKTLLVEATLMILPIIVALIYGESILGFAMTIVMIAALCVPALLIIRQKRSDIRAREGFVTVAVVWVLMSVFGALPFVIEGQIPSFIDAFFETVSGFTTTGSTILKDVEALSYSLLFWRSFTHFIGGMGVLVFVLAIIPLADESSMHVMRAEVPGPTMGKLVPKIKDSAKILYILYILLTLIEAVMLLIGGMDLFDALIVSFGTAGTGGFATKNASIGYYESSYIHIVVATFMLLFALNFNLYYYLMLRHFKSVFKNEEMHAFILIVFASVAAITINILPRYENALIAIRDAYFQVTSIISTTGFATVDFNTWPEFSKTLLVAIMFIGGCAGSTAGGLKVGRIVMIFKSFRQEILHMLHPRYASVVKLDGKVVEKGTLYGTLVHFALYMCILLVSILIVSLDGFDFTTNVTGVISCMSNIGPGLALVGPTGNFSIFSPIIKLVLSVDMLFGRLEVFPLLMIMTPTFWKRK